MNSIGRVVYFSCAAAVNAAPHSARTARTCTKEELLLRTYLFLFISFGVSQSERGGDCFFRFRNSTWPGLSPGAGVAPRSGFKSSKTRAKMQALSFWLDRMEIS